MPIVGWIQKHSVFVPFYLQMANKSLNISIYAKPQPKGLSDKLLEMSFQLYISLASASQCVWWVTQTLNSKHRVLGLGLSPQKP